MDRLEFHLATCRVSFRINFSKLIHMNLEKSAGCICLITGKERQNQKVLLKKQTGALCYFFFLLKELLP